MSDGINIDMEKLKETFFIESDEHTSNMESSILELENNSDDAELLNGIFRAAHSIKGNSGCLGYTDIYSFTHVLETFMDRLRNGEMEVSKEVISLLLESLDCIKSLVTAAREEVECDVDVEETLSKLEAFTKEENENTAEEIFVDAEAEDVPVATKSRLVRVIFRPDPEILKRGMKPFNIIKKLSAMGEVVRVIPDMSILPDINNLDPELCYLSWKVLLLTEADEEALGKVFAFVGDESYVEIVDLEEDAFGLEQDEENFRSGIPKSTSAQEKEGLPGEISESIPVLKESKKEEDRAPAPKAKGKKIKKAAQKVETTIRVDTDKVDKLVNLAGELLITQSMVSQLTIGVQDKKGGALQKAVAELERNTMEIQEMVMSVRMLPIGNVFNRFQRLVRDLAVKKDKTVNLKISGEDTELDKTVIERLVDPLTHLLRNSIDHGIEVSSERTAAGKEEAGSVSLNAYHEGGNVVITVEDDGKGLDRDAILRKAIERGIVEEDRELSEKEINSLIFMPGFSTVETITDLSGRGVGMDVVKRNIEDMGGSVMIESERGSFTRFVLKLPLTLAVIEGLTVSVGDEMFVLPITTVIESKRPLREELKTIEGKGEVMYFRGDYLPIIRLHRLFSIKPVEERPWRALVVVITVGGKDYGLLVDELVGEQQVVIKTLGSLHGLPGVAGATILGDGKVALIIDAVGLLKRAFLSEEKETMTINGGCSEEMKLSANA